jgi:L,D-peptidoglycan transpeptidase YkuD (ErfK/YbiS/YcfS/YnhG family)
MMKNPEAKKRVDPLPGDEAAKRGSPLNPAAGHETVMPGRRKIKGVCATIRGTFRPSAWLPARVAAAAALMVALSASPAMAAEGPSLQALIVTTDSWSSVDATLRLYERKEARSAWIPAGDRVPAIVGRNGLAWGRGVHPDQAAEGDRKREGDGKAPAGIFRLGPAFGDAPGGSVPWIGLPYRQMKESSRCVDDPASPAYNRLVEEGSVPKEWGSSEEMRRNDGQYRLGIVIGHNADPVAPGCGSCIFLHIWKSPSSGTSGCTAVSDASLEGILHRLRPDANPVLIQLPRGEYERLRGPWDLP